jgi:fatty acid desaturase
MSNDSKAIKGRAARPTWHQDIAGYARSNPRKAIWQLVNTFVPYLGLWILMVYTVKTGVSYWVTLALAVVAAAFLVRIFIFFHDCGHGPIGSFLIAQRFSRKGGKRRERVSVRLTNLAILAIVVLLSLAIGFWTYLQIQLPIILIAGALGLWLFYVQHQYEGVYWARQEAWDSSKAALDGSSYYKLPKVLQWFTGNIGLHHIHHLRPRIPNYNLQQCYDEIPAMQAVQPLTIRKSLKSLRMNLWDEQHQKLVSFRSLA